MSPITRASAVYSGGIQRRQNDPSVPAPADEETTTTKATTTKPTTTNTTTTTTSDDSSNPLANILGDDDDSASGPTATTTTKPTTTTTKPAPSATVPPGVAVNAESTTTTTTGPTTAKGPTAGVGDTVSGIKEQCLSSTSADGACAASAKAGLKEHPAAIAAIVIIPIFVLAFVIYCWKDHRKGKKEERTRKRDMEEAKKMAMLSSLRK